MFDDLSDTAVDALKASGGILKSMSKSIFTKNLDELIVHTIPFTHQLLAKEPKSSKFLVNMLFDILLK